MSNKMKFKSNLTCNGCVSKVKPHLEKLDIQNWNVDLKGKESEVIVEGNVKEDDVMRAFEAAGYKAVPKKGFLGGIFG